MNNEILVIAGAIAVKKWEFDPTEIKVKFVNSLEPFKIRMPMPEIVTIPTATTPIPPSDDMIFEYHPYWQKGNIKFWLAWGPITKTLAIYLDSNEWRDAKHHKTPALPSIGRRQR